MSLPLGQMRHTIYLERPVQVADNEGGYTESFVALDPPTAKASIVSASQRRLEQIVSGTVIGEASVVITMRFHKDVDLKTRIRWTDRMGKAHIANVLTVDDVESRGVELLIVASEIIQ